MYTMGMSRRSSKVSPYRLVCTQDRIKNARYIANQTKCSEVKRSAHETTSLYSSYCSCLVCSFQIQKHNFNFIVFCFSEFWQERCCLIAVTTFLSFLYYLQHIF